MSNRLPIGSVPTVVGDEPAWTVQCHGLVGAWCGLVVEGPQAGQYLAPPFLAHASSTLCEACQARMAEQIRNRHQRAS